MKSNGWNPVELRDTRYNQIIHMVSSAKGAEDFYTVQVSASIFISINGSMKIETSNKSTSYQQNPIGFQKLEIFSENSLLSCSIYLKRK